tara:strand:+ start:6812 stop:7933 length:1122 start_codon:yes stop_codon:yes gene_type:complete
MRIESIEVINTKLPLKSEFSISRGSVADKSVGAPHIYVKLKVDSGLVGWGECRPSHRWSYETEETVLSTLTNYIVPAIIDMDITDIQSIHKVMDTEIAPSTHPGQPIAKSSIDLAIHDVLAKNVNQPLYEFFGSNKKVKIPLCYTVFANKPSEAGNIVKDAVEEGYKCFKVKLGHDSIIEDLRILESIVKYASGGIIWADPNQAYNVKNTIKYSSEFSNLGVNYLEQPIPAGDITGHEKIKDHCSIPIAVDESIFSIDTLNEFITRKAADVFVVKVCKMTGLHRSSKAIEIALDAGMEVLASSLTESRLAMAAGASLFSSFGLEVPMDLNGWQFLADDITSGGVTVEKGEICLEGLPGLGAMVDEDKVLSFKQ